MASSRIKQSGCSWHVVKATNNIVETNRLIQRFRQSQSHTHEKPLRSFDELSRLRRAKQITIGHGLQPKVIKKIITLMPNRILDGRNILLSQLINVSA